jgi:hypothetical protein
VATLIDDLARCEILRHPRLATRREVGSACVHSKIDARKFASGQAGVVQFPDANDIVDLFHDGVDTPVLQVKGDLNLGIALQKGR